MPEDIGEDRQPLPEKPEDSEFLLDLPEDFDFYAATVRTEALIGSLTGKFNVHLLSAIKESLHMPIVVPVNRSATIVILNVIEETKEMCGFASPEIIFSKLKQRRARAKRPSNS